MARSLGIFSKLKNSKPVRDNTGSRLHRSFQHTPRKQAVRPLELPGYIAFTIEVCKIFISNRKIFVGLIISYALLIVIFGGISNQDIYSQIDGFVGGDEASLIDSVGQAGLAALLGFGGSGAAMSDVQQVYLMLAVLLVWLSTVWLIREIMAGRTPKLRDGVYNSGAPIVSTGLLCLVLLVQLLPLGILAIVYSGLVQVGLATEGLGAMLFFGVTALTCALCLYWVSATFIALVTVTLPGMYPLQAHKLAREVVAGRRLVVMYRILWLIAFVLIAILITLTPVILIDQWLRSLAEWVTLIPLLPVANALVGAATTVFAASYIYLLYRKVIAYDAEASR